MSSKIADKRREKYANDPDFRERVKNYSYKWRRTHREEYNRYIREWNKKHKSVKDKE
jgi:hypothetical protein